MRGMQSWSFSHWSFFVQESILQLPYLITWIAGMPIDLDCPGCGKKLRLADEHAGKAGRCPACQAVFQIPAVSDSPRPFGGGLAQAPSSGAGLAGGALLAGSEGGNPFSEPKPSPYAVSNPYASPQTQNAYSGPPGDGVGTASIVLGVVTIATAPFACCCFMWFVTFPLGIIGLVLAFVAPPHQRNMGLILNGVGMVLAVLVVALQILIPLLRSLH